MSDYTISVSREELMLIIGLLNISDKLDDKLGVNGYGLWLRLRTILTEEDARAANDAAEDFKLKECKY